MAIENIGRDNPTEMRLNNLSKEFLRETAKWANFLSILGFILIGLLVIIALFAGTLMSTFSNGFGGSGMSGAFVTILYLLMALLYFFPVYYLFKFASNMKKALAIDNEDALTKGFEYLKSHYKFIGIFTIILLSLYLILFFIGIAGAASSF